MSSTILKTEIGIFVLGAHRAELIGRLLQGGLTFLYRIRGPSHCRADIRVADIHPVESLQVDDISVGSRISKYPMHGDPHYICFDDQGIVVRLGHHGRIGFCEYYRPWVGPLALIQIGHAHNGGKRVRSLIGGAGLSLIGFPLTLQPHILFLEDQDLLDMLGGRWQLILPFIASGIVPNILIQPAIIAGSDQGTDQMSAVAGIMADGLVESALPRFVQFGGVYCHWPRS